jgi:fucose permease
MTSRGGAAASSDDAPARRLAGLLFAMNGLLYGMWVTRIPSVKASGDLSDSRLGLALLAMGIGTFVSLPIATRWLALQPSWRVTTWACIASSMALGGVACALSVNFTVLVVALFAFGSALACMDIAMNAHAAALEKRAGRSIMSSLHAMWSVGALFAAGASAAFAHAGTGAPVQFGASALALGATGLFLAQRPATVAETSTRGGFTWPPRAVLGIGLFAAAAAIVEGGIAEWSGVYLTEYQEASAGLAALGYGGFALAMLAGRVVGDRVIDRMGHASTLRAGALLGAAALLAMLLAPGAPWALATLAAAGLGISVVFPVAFSVAGRLGGVAPASAIAALATMAYGSGLTGPPLIGFLSDASSLPLALGLLVLMCLAIAALAGRARTQG